MDSAPPIENAHRDYELEMELLKRRIASKDSHRMLLWSLMRGAAKRDEGWESAANELADASESYLSPMPWHLPSGLDARRAASELVKFFWPILMEWREGFVDQSEFHILVRSGGTELTKDEPPGIDIAVIGPGEFGQLVVEFLPMFGVDPEAARDAKAVARRLLTRTVDRGRGDAWSYAQHHCGTGANMYSRVRFVPRGGREAVRYVNEFHAAEQGSVPKQAPRIEGTGGLGRFSVYNREKYVGVHLVTGEETIKGWLSHLTHDCVAVVLTRPLYGGCVMRTIFRPYSSGDLIDEQGWLTQHGVQVVVELIHDMHQAASVMAGQVTELKRALARASRQLRNGEVRIGKGEEPWYALVHRCSSEPLSDIDLPFFKSVLSAWLVRERLGLPESWHDA